MFGGTTLSQTHCLIQSLSLATKILDRVTAGAFLVAGHVEEAYVVWVLPHAARPEVKFLSRSETRVSAVEAHGGNVSLVALVLQERMVRTPKFLIG